MSRGSHPTRGGWEPKHCSVCGQPIRVSKDPALWFHKDHDDGGRVYAWHMACKLPITEKELLNP